MVEWSYQPAWRLGSIALVAAIAITSIILIPACQGVWHRDRLEGKELPLFVNEARRTILQFWGGTVVLFGLYFGWRRMIATDEANRIERDRHVTEQFANAIEKIGHNDIAVRCGAIFTLERFAGETPRMAWTVAQILNRFVRGRTLVQRPFQDDVQTALTVLGRRPWAHLEEAHQKIVRVPKILTTSFPEILAT